MLLHLLLEHFSHQQQPRVPEPELIMCNASHNEAFLDAGRKGGILAPIYLYHALQISRVVCAGDLVLDLACGPANQLLQIARLNPDARFVGLDASCEMLGQARNTLADVGNVELAAGDMTRLNGIKDVSMDCVICTMSLHHLPDLAALLTTIGEVARVLKPGGGFYLVDFARFKRASTQHFFSQDRRESQSEQFTQDYFDSMRAAFSLEELTSATAPLNPLCHQTALAPFMVVFRSEDRRNMDEASALLARDLYGQLSVELQRDFHNFARWFRAGGFALPCELA